jgi:hypothetical protein
MANPSELLQLFPSAPKERAEWRAIYLEPIIGSGERLTIAVAVTSAGSSHVERALPDSVLDCMYGARSDAIGDLIDLVIKDLAAHLDGGASLDAWRPPFDGTVTLGAMSIALGGSLEAIARTGLQMTSSIGGGRGELSNDVADRQLSLASADRWEAAVRAAVLNDRPDWEDRFGTSFRFREGTAMTRIGYAGPRVAAHFLRLLPASLSRHRQQGKAKIFDLRALRDVDGAAPRASYELLLWRPTTVSMEHDERQIENVRAAADEFEAFADKHQLIVKTMKDESAAAARLIRLEQAG